MLILLIQWQNSTLSSWEETEVHWPQPDQTGSLTDVTGEDEARDNISHNNWQNVRWRRKVSKTKLRNFMIGNDIKIHENHQHTLGEKI